MAGHPLPAPPPAPTDASPGSVRSDYRYRTSLRRQRLAKDKRERFERRAARGGAASSASSVVSTEVEGPQDLYGHTFCVGPGLRAEAAPSPERKLKHQPTFSNPATLPPEEMQRDELVALVHRLRREMAENDTRQNARRAFELFDVDQSGDIDEEELVHALEMLGKDCEPEDVEAFLDKCGALDTRKITEEQFLNEYVNSVANAPRM